MNLLQKSDNLQNLPPRARAALRMLKAVVYIVILNALLAAGQYLSSNGVIHWTQLAQVIFAQVALALALTVDKYCAALGEPTLALAIAPVEQQLAKRLPDAAAPVVPDATIQASLSDLPTITSLS